MYSFVSAPSPARQRGFVIAVETLLFASILVIGTVVGWVMIRDSINAELIDTANAIQGAVGFAYFADPLRGTGPPPAFDSLDFVDPVGEGNTEIQLGFNEEPEAP